MPLTDTECRKAQPKDKQYRLSDSHGLSLIITTKGQKYWNVRVTVHGERKSESLGPYPDLSLKKARELAYELKHRYSRSVLHEDLKPYFKEVAEDWFNNQKETWSSKHISNVRASLDELYIALANKRINQIQAPEILQIIKKIEARGSLEIAKRTLSRCGMVMKYAIAHGYRYDNPAGDLVYALKNKRVKNLASLTASEMPEFLRRIKAYPTLDSRIGLQLLTLLFTRPSELREAKWEEFDLENALWTIPDFRMKKRREHTIPLSKQAVQLLQELKNIHSESDYLFPSRSNKNKPKSDTVFIMALRRLGYEGRQTPHGFRHIASTILNNKGFDERHIESALAHVKDGVAGVYNKAQYLEDRARLMQWYADYLEELADMKVIQFKKAN